MDEKKQKTDDNQDLAIKVKKWVEEQGYSLEMRVAKKFHENGFAVSQFDHFIDQESHSVRPVDVVATLSQDFGNSRVDIKLFIECKYSAKDKPWVIVVTSDKFAKLAYFSRTVDRYLPSDWSKVESLQGRLTARLIQNIERDKGLDIFLISKPGYVVAEAFKTQGDHAYEAIMQISKCVEAHDIKAEQFYQGTVREWEQLIENHIPSSELGLLSSIAFPVVVINGQLFESYLTEDNVVEVCEIESGTVFVPKRHRETNPYTGIILSPVTVVTEKHLDNYVFSIKKAFENLLIQAEAIQDVIRFEQSQIVNPQYNDEF